jgi:hypothetical protein
MNDQDEGTSYRDDKEDNNCSIEFLSGIVRCTNSIFIRYSSDRSVNDVNYLHSSVTLFILNEHTFAVWKFIHNSKLKDMKKLLIISAAWCCLQLFIGTKGIGIYLLCPGQLDPRADFGGTVRDQAVSFSVVMDIWEQDSMAPLCTRISGNGIRVLTRGHKKRTSVERQDILLLVFPLEQKDI